MAYVTCTICGFNKELSDDLIGKTASCPKCNERLRVMARDLDDLISPEPTDARAVVIPDHSAVLKKIAKDVGFLASVARVIVALWLITVVLFFVNQVVKIAR